MSFLNLAQERCSVRSFSQKTIDEDSLHRVFMAAQIAPTAANKQPHRFYLVDTEEKLAKLSLCTRYDFKAPLVIVIGYDINASWKRSLDQYDGGEVDCSIVATHMMLQATEEGLGTCWIGAFDPKLCKEIFQLPQWFKPVLLLPIGYPSENFVPNKLHHIRDDYQTKIIVD